MSEHELEKDEIKKYIKNMKRIIYVGYSVTLILFVSTYILIYGFGSDAHNELKYQIITIFMLLFLFMYSISKLIKSSVKRKIQYTNEDFGLSLDFKEEWRS